MRDEKKCRQAELESRRKDLIYFRDWIHSHPNRVDPKVRPAAIDFLNNSIAELDKLSEMENARRAGRTSLRDRLRTLVAAIVSQTMPTGK